MVTVHGCILFISREDTNDAEIYFLYEFQIYKTLF
jgi:hypothetical protein